MSIALICCPFFVSAATLSWTGNFLFNPNDLNNACNWSGGCLGTVPTIGDTALFTSAGSHTPNLIPVIVPIFFQPDTIRFQPNALSYTFTFDSSLGQTGLQISNGGILNLSGAAQSFNFINSLFPAGSPNTSSINNCSMDVTASGLNTFNFFDSSELDLLGNAQTSNATLNAFGSSSITLQNTSRAFNGTINIYNNASINFEDSSDPFNALINLRNNGALTFDTNIGTSSFGGPFITMFNASTVTLDQNISIASLNSSSANTSVNLGIRNLTINQPSGQNDTYAGLITGTGQLTLSDADTTASLRLTRAQNPADTWQANVSVGTLIGNTTNLNRSLVIGAQGTVRFKQTSNGVFDQSITGSGTLDTVGPGTLRIASNNSSFAGTTNVLSGTLNLTGRLGGHINVFGQLTGTGIASDLVEVQNGGVISPNGNQIGTLTVGDYLHQPGGDYLVNINGSGASDLIRATTFQTNGTGIANILGGRVVVAPVNNNFLLNVPYTIVTAENGRFGRYDSVIGFNPVLIPVLSYDPNNVYLTLIADFIPITETRNQRAVAEQLNTIDNSSPAFDLLESLVFLPLNELRDALDQLSGEQYTALMPAIQQTNQRFIRSINLPNRLNIFDPCEQKCQCEGFWADVQYARSLVKSDHNADGYSIKIFDAFIATQVQLCPCITGGVAFYYESDFIKFDLNGSAHMNTGLGSLFGVYQNNSFYSLGDLFLGYSYNRFKRHLDFGDFHESTKSDPRIYDVGFYAEFGTNYNYWSNFVVQPFAAAEVDYLYRPTFKEHKGESANLRAKSQEYWGCDTFLGLRTKAAFCGGFEVIAEASWQHRFNNEINSIKLNFEEFGDEFKIIGPKLGQDAIAGSLIFALNAADGRKVFAEAYGEQWSHYTDYGFTVGFDFEW